LISFTLRKSYDLYTLTLSPPWPPFNLWTSLNYINSLSLWPPLNLQPPWQHPLTL
jgi:hypothetical protein